VLGQRLDLGVLGERLPLVRQLLEADVEVLDVEESDLVGGRGVQLGAPGESGSEGALGAFPGGAVVDDDGRADAAWADAAWAVQGSVTVLETWTLRPQPWRSEISSSWAAASSHQGHSVAQWAASSSASGCCARASDAGWWRRSAVRKASTPAARTWSKRLSPEPPLTATLRTGAPGSPATRMPWAVAGSRAA